MKYSNLVLTMGKKICLQNLFLFLSIKNTQHFSRRFCPQFSINHQPTHKKLCITNSVLIDTKKNHCLKGLR